jgi:hypothetical protein
MGSGFDMRHLWPSDSPRFIITKKKKTVPVPPKRTITAFVGFYVRSKDYQTAKCLCRPGPHPLKKGKAVKEKNLQPPLFFFPKKLVSYLTPSRFTFKINVRMRIV